MDGALEDALARSRRHFTKVGGRQADDFHRYWWSHNKVMRSTHGGN